jgi:hypothetical protein
MLAKVECCIHYEIPCRLVTLWQANKGTATRSLPAVSQFKLSLCSFWLYIFARLNYLDLELLLCLYDCLLSSACIILFVYILDPKEIAIDQRRLSSAVDEIFLLCYGRVNPFLWAYRIKKPKNRESLLLRESSITLWNWYDILLLKYTARSENRERERERCSDSFSTKVSLLCTHEPGNKAITMLQHCK